MMSQVFISTGLFLVLMFFLLEIRENITEDEKKFVRNLLTRARKYLKI